MRNSNLSVDFERVIGPVRELNGVGQPPLMGIDTEKFHYLTEANVPYSRLHDVGGWFGGNMFVDIPNIFRDFDADVNDPESYDFAFTDILIKGLVDSGCEPYYRLGVTIENFHKIKSYRIFPPSDYEKWARICEHIIRHYNEGWANGFHYNIKHWEIWNEQEGCPNNGEFELLPADINENAMWKGSREQFYDLYRVTSRHLRKCFGDSIKIGGYGSCGLYIANMEQTVDGKAFGGSNGMSDWDKRILWFYIFFKDFIKMVKEENLPFDFFTHHSYAGVEDSIKMERLAEEELSKAGLDNVEIHLNEWNTHNERAHRGSSVAAANTAAMMCAMHDTKVNIMCYYDARIGVSVFGGLFNPDTALPVSTYYSIYAYGKLRALGSRVEVTQSGEKVYCLAATDKKGEKKAIMIANIGEETLVKTDIKSDATVRLIDREHLFTEEAIKADEFVLGENQVAFIELDR